MKRYTVVAIFRGTEVLMLYKVRGPFTEVWNLPGGKIEFGEDIISSGCREVMEETGIKVERGDVVHLIAMKYIEFIPAELHLLTVRVSEDTEFTQIEDEPLCWFDVDCVIDNQVETAGYLNVPHFVSLAWNYFIANDKLAGIK